MSPQSTVSKPPVKADGKLTAALTLLERGFSVIPLHGPGMPLPPGKPDDDAGKVPLVETWREFQQRKPTEAEVRKWWAKYPEANVGIVTGKLSGVIAFDVDGPEAEHFIAETFLGEPETLTSEASRGPHYLFAHPGFEVRNSAGSIVPGLDVRGDGGYIVAPGSVHRGGHIYAWRDPDAKPAPIPQVLQPLLRRKQAEDGEQQRMAPEEIDEFLQGVTQGQRHKQIITIAGHYIGIGLPRREVERIALAANALNKPPAPAEHVLVRVRDIWKRDRERKAHPDDPDEFSRIGDTFIIRWTDLVEVRVNSVREGSDGLHAEVQVFSPRGDRLHYGHLKLASTSQREDLVKKLASRLHSVHWADILEHLCWRIVEEYRKGEPTVALSTLSPSRTQRHLLAGGLLRDAETNMLYADGGEGKSNLAELFGLIVATGVPIAGIVPTRQGAVLYLDYEDDAEAHRAYIAAMAVGHALPFPENFYYRRMTRPLSEEVPRIKADVERLNVALVILDSYIPAAGAEPESNDAAQRTMRALAEFHPAARLVLTHVSKADADRRGDGRPFGGVSVRNLPRNAWRVHGERDGSSLTVTLRHNKVNRGRLRPALARRFDFYGAEDIPESIMVSPVEAMPEEHLTLTEDVRKLMAEGVTNARTILDRLGLPQDERNAGKVRRLMSRIRKRTIGASENLPDSGTPF